MDNGVVYIAFDGGSKSNIKKELQHSINSVRKAYEDIANITLFTDVDPKLNGIDNIRIIDIDSDRVKQKYLVESPYQNTLYLDCDTEIQSSINDMFELMSRFDMAAVPDLIRKDPKKSVKYPDYSAIPASFPEFGGGVILFRKTMATQVFFEMWRKNYKIWYDLTGETRDQPSFRVSLWKCNDLKFYSLPEEYNKRTKNYSNITTRILHAHNLWRR